MKLVIDTNIIFSALLNPHSNISLILANFHGNLSFYAPELLITELEKYEMKIEQFSKLKPLDIEKLKDYIFSNIEFVSEELISQQSWQEAFELAKDIDEYDTPFIALALELKAKLWTGDKKLQRGLELKGSNLITSTNILASIFD